MIAGSVVIEGSPALVTFASPIPILRIFDLTKAMAFYRDYLGFAVDWEHRFEVNLPVYLQLSLQDCRIHLSEHHGDACPGSALRIGCDDVERFHAALAAKNYRYARPGVMTTPWRTREMTITDPFGNRLTFYQSLEAG